MYGQSEIEDPVYPPMYNTDSLWLEAKTNLSIDTNWIEIPLRKERSIACMKPNAMEGKKYRVITSRIDMEKLVRLNHPKDGRLCTMIMDSLVPNVDFSEKDLLVFIADGGGCRKKYYRPRLFYNPLENKYQYIGLGVYIGNCLMLITEMDFYSVPKLNDGSTVNFEFRRFNIQPLKDEFLEERKK
jgi:hypothetical protein